MHRWGIALSGGGLLGAAHLGVWRAFEEMGRVPHFYAGTSAGGLVAPLWAARIPFNRVYQTGLTVTQNPRKFFTLPVRHMLAELCGRSRTPLSGLIDPTRFLEELLALLPYRTMSDLPAPVVLTAVDLAREVAVAFSSRPLEPPFLRWEIETGTLLALAMRATMSMPAVFVPVVDQNRLLVDGGMADTLPVDWAAHLGAERVIAVDVTPGEPLSPSQIGLGGVLSRTEHYMTTTLSQLRDPAGYPRYTVTVPTGSVGALDFSAYAELVRLGHQAVKSHQAAIEEFLDRDLTPPATAKSASKIGWKPIEKAIAPIGRARRE